LVPDFPLFCPDFAPKPHFSAKLADFLKGRIPRRGLRFGLPILTAKNVERVGSSAPLVLLFCWLAAGFGHLSGVFGSLFPDP